MQQKLEMYLIIKITLFSLLKYMWNEISCLSFLQTIFDQTINMKLILGVFFFGEKYTKLFSLGNFLSLTKNQQFHIKGLYLVYLNIFPHCQPIFDDDMNRSAFFFIDDVTSDFEISSFYRFSEGFLSPVLILNYYNSRYKLEIENKKRQQTED